MLVVSSAKSCSATATQVGRARRYSQLKLRSRTRMLEDCARHKLNTDGDFFYTENYLKLDNTNLTPEEAARRIADAFGLMQKQ